MPLIIDNDVIGKVFIQNNDDYLPVKNALINYRNIMVYGGKLLREYILSLKIRRILIRYDQSGRARKYSDTDTDKETIIIKKLQLCKSNDEHIIALARISRARVLCSGDKDLHADFKNKYLIDSPRGKIYQNLKHLDVLKDDCANFLSR